jgi:porin
LIDVHIEIELGEMLGAAPGSWERGATVFLDAYVQAGRDGSQDVGDNQAYSNIDSPNTRQLAELWYEQRFFDDLFRTKIGKADANNEFNLLASNGDFLHSSATLTPTIVGMPSYPDPAMSVSVFCETECFFFGVGLFDGASADGVGTGRRGPSTFFNDRRSSSYFCIVEFGGAWCGGRAALGAWHHTADFARFDGGRESGTEGYYLQVEQRVWRERPTDEVDEQGLRGFLVFSRADGEVSEFEGHAEVGLTYTGAIPGRDFDVTGLLITRADLTEATSAGFASDETAIEWFYKVQVTQALSITPDLQFISHPSGSRGVEDAWVGSLRFVLTF